MFVEIYLKTDVNSWIGGKIDSIAICYEVPSVENFMSVIGF